VLQYRGEGVSVCNADEEFTNCLVIMGLY